MKSVLKTPENHMLRLFREVERSGEALVVTDSNKPVLKVVLDGTNRHRYLLALSANHHSRSVDEPTPQRTYGLKYARFSRFYYSRPS